jgi:hypothetical protein
MKHLALCLLVLPAFLVANILTGAANAACDAVWGATLDVPDAPALAVLLAYVGAVCAAAFAGWRRGPSKARQ